MPKNKITWLRNGVKFAECTVDAAGMAGRSIYFSVIMYSSGDFADI